MYDPILYFALSPVLKVTVTTMKRAVSNLVEDGKLPLLEDEGDALVRTCMHAICINVVELSRRRDLMGAMHMCSPELCFDRVPYSLRSTGLKPKSRVSSCRRRCLLRFS